MLYQLQHLLSTIAFTQTNKSYVDNKLHPRRAKKFKQWARSLAVENIKIKHNLKGKEVNERVKDTIKKFYEFFPNFTENYCNNVSALRDVLKSSLEVEKENEIKNKLELFSEREKKAAAFLMECPKLGLPATLSLDGEIVALHSRISSGLGRCNHIINLIFSKENYGRNKSFKTFKGGNLFELREKIEIPRYEIGDIIVKSGLGFWSPHVQAHMFDIDIVFPNWLLMKEWNLPRIPDFDFKDIERDVEQIERMEQTTGGFVAPYKF